MTERTIATVLSWRYVRKVGRCVARLAFPDGEAEEIWMSPRQLDHLLGLLEETPKGWSTRRRTVIGVWNENGYYAYSRMHRDDSVKYPPNYDLSDLEDDL